MRISPARLATKFTPNCVLDLRNVSREDSARSIIAEALLRELAGHTGPVYCVAFTPDGKTLFTANGPSGDVSVVDLATNTVTKKIKGGTGTYSIVVLPK